MCPAPRLRSTARSTFDTTAGQQQPASIISDLILRFPQGHQRCAPALYVCSGSRAKSAKLAKRQRPKSIQPPEVQYYSTPCVPFPKIRLPTTLEHKPPTPKHKKARRAGGPFRVVAKSGISWPTDQYDRPLPPCPTTAWLRHPPGRARSRKSLAPWTAFHLPRRQAP